MLYGATSGELSDFVFVAVHYGGAWSAGYVIRRRAVVGCHHSIIRFQAQLTGLCRACRQVTLPCEACGKPVTRDPNAINFGRPRKSPRLFCDKTCSGRWLGRRNARRDHGTIRATTSVVQSGA